MLEKGAKRVKFQAPPCLALAVWPWASHFPSPGLSVLTCKTRQLDQVIPEVLPALVHCHAEQRGEPSPPRSSVMNGMWSGPGHALAGRWPAGWWDWWSPRGTPQPWASIPTVPPSCGLRPLLQARSRSESQSGRALRDSPASGSR